jgi:hypothetical protein
MSWLDKFFFGIQLVQVDGVQLPAEPVLNFANATGTDDPLNNRTNITLASSSAIGGGIPTSSQSGAITFSAGTQCVAVDLRTADATADMSTFPSPVTGVAVQFDLQEGLKSILFTGATFLTPEDTTGTLSQFKITGGGQSVILKRTALGNWQTL